MQTCVNLSSPLLMKICMIFVPASFFKRRLRSCCSMEWTVLPVGHIGELMTPVLTAYNSC